MISSADRQLTSLFDRMEAQLKVPLSSRLRDVKKHAKASAALKTRSEEISVRIDELAPELQDSLDGVRLSTDDQQQLQNSSVEEIASNSAMAQQKLLETQISSTAELADTSAEIFKSSVETLELEQQINAYCMKGYQAKVFREQAYCLEVLDSLNLVAPMGKLPSRSTEKNWMRLKTVVDSRLELEIEQPVDFEIVQGLVLPVSESSGDYLEFSDDVLEQLVNSDEDSTGSELWPSPTLDDGFESAPEDEPPSIMAPPSPVSSS